jgi:1A family penicillin-binding protein
MSASPAPQPPPAPPVPSPAHSSRWRRWPLYTLLAVVALLTIAATHWLVTHVVSIHRLRRGVGDTIFYTGDGRPWFRLDEHRRDVHLDDISPYLQKAVVAVEDHRFYRHIGIDPISLGRATLHNLRAHHLVEGGSTLTQQLARTLYLSTHRTYARKLKEAMLALIIERQLSKDQILELYLNRVYLGSGLYGVETLSRKCLGKPARDLTLGEAALVAGLIQSPASLSPWEHLDAARRRRRVVLARMHEQGFITAAQESQAASEAVHVGPPPRLQDARWGYAKEYLREEFAERIGGDHPPDWRVDTTLLPQVQDAAEAAVAHGLKRLGGSGLQAALCAIDPASGHVLAIVGGSDAVEFPFNRAVRSRRQPGSAFKPFVYAAALEHGFSPVSVLKDLHSIQIGEREEWSPRNHEDSPDQQTLREALFESNNEAAVALQQKVGTKEVLKLASAAGLRDLPDVPSLALGSGLVSPLDLAAAYAIFPNGGYAVSTRGITRVFDANGSTVLDESQTPSVRVLSEPVAFQMVTMLRDVIDVGTAARARDLGLRVVAAGKTGTTNDFHDAWFVGFTRGMVAAVWVGHDQPEAIGEEAYAARVALPIWTEFVNRASLSVPAGEFDIPDGVTPVKLCRVSYLRAVSECPAYTEYFKDSDEIPHEKCPIHGGNVVHDIGKAVGHFFDSLGKKLKGLFK